MLNTMYILLPVAGFCERDGERERERVHSTHIHTHTDSLFWRHRRSRGKTGKQSWSSARRCAKQKESMDTVSAASCSSVRGRACNHLCPCELAFALKVTRTHTHKLGGWVGGWVTDWRLGGCGGVWVGGACGWVVVHQDGAMEQQLLQPMLFWATTSVDDPNEVGSGAGSYIAAVQEVLTGAQASIDLIYDGETAHKVSQSLTKCAC
jgi:hypothetical protein